MKFNPSCSPASFCRGPTQAYPYRLARDKPARCGRLRTHGAFLVSSELREGEILSVRIESEHGRECVLQNPWPGRELTLERNGRPAEKRSGERIAFPTSPAERIVLRP